MRSLAYGALPMWLEPVLLSTRLAWADGRLVGPLEPLAVTGPLRLGGRGSGADLAWELGRELTVSPEGGALRFTWAAPTRSRLVGPGEVWCDDGVGGPSFRVFAARGESCGWPADRAAPLGPWDDGLLGVLGDALLEAGHALGARLWARTPGEDLAWLPLLALMAPSRFVVTWRRGVVDTLTLEPSATWAFGRSLARHGVCVPMRALVLRSDAFGLHGLLRVVAGVIAGGGLPCLETLRCEVRPAPGAAPDLAAFQRELAHLPGLKGGLPTLRVLEVAPAG